jgi:septal ring factor EnvC (AmiA/AmiB activator)
MGLFGFRKKKDIEEVIKRQIEEKNEIKEDNEKERISLESSLESVEERRRKLAKRILEMSTKLDNLSTQLYHLQQRVELLERKLNIERLE